MPDFNNNCIYKICCKDVNVTDIYVGHTTNFKGRKWKHKSSCNNEKSILYNSYIYRFIRMNGGWNNFAMVHLYNYPCENITQACIEERNCIERLGAKLNSISPYQSVEERKENEKLYYEINKEKIKEYSNNNKEKIKERQKKYRIDNKEKVKEHYQINKEKIKEQHKKYQIDNKEKIKEQRKKYKIDNKEKIKELQKKYRIDNKEKIKEQQKEYAEKKVNCPNCNKLLCRSSLYNHFRTKKCQSFKINQK